MRLPDGLHWNVLGLFEELKAGLRKARAEAGPGGLAAAGLDTWGVDFGLLDARGDLLGNPFHYRDSRTDGMMEKAWAVTGREAIFEATGIQFMQINSLFQLLALKRRGAPALEAAQTFLTMPDLFNYWLTGRKVSEFSIATTTQCYDPRARDWARPLLERLGIPTRIFPEIVPTGTVLGELLPWVAEETGLAGMQVIAPACHDTGSAVAAVPAAQAGFAYLSSGTWSLLGAELPAPVINPASLALNVTNEGGVGGTIRFLKNIIGLWIVQECRRVWQTQAGAPISYDDITRLAAEAEPLPLVDRPRLARVPAAGRHAGAHRRVLPAHRPTHPRRARASSSAARWKAWRSNTARRSKAWRACWASASTRCTSSAAAPRTSCSTSSPPTPSPAR